MFFLKMYKGYEKSPIIKFSDFRFKLFNPIGTLSSPG